MIKSWPDPNSLLHRSTLVLLFTIFTSKARAAARRTHRNSCWSWEQGSIMSLRKCQEVFLVWRSVMKMTRIDLVSGKISTMVWCWSFFLSWCMCHSVSCVLHLHDTNQVWLWGEQEEQPDLLWTSLRPKGNPQFSGDKGGTQEFCRCFEYSCSLVWFEGQNNLMTKVKDDVLITFSRCWQCCEPTLACGGT